MKILIISDSEQIKERLKDALRINATELQIFEKMLGDPRSIESVNDNMPDVILIMLNYSSMTNLKKFRIIKERYPNISLILYCYYGCTNYRQLKEDIKADYYLEKPSGLEKVHRILKDLEKEKFETV